MRMIIFSLGDFFVLLLLLPVVLRPLLHKEGTPDRIAIFAPFAFFISLLLLFSEGLSVKTLSICLTSFFVFFFNIRSLIRCFQKLPVDIFSPAAKIGCFLGFVLIFANGYLLFRHYPAKDVYRINKSPLTYVNVQKIFYGGTFEAGFEPLQKNQKASAKFYIFNFEGKPQKATPEKKFEIKEAWQNLLNNTKIISPNEKNENAENIEAVQIEEKLENTENFKTAQDFESVQNGEVLKNAQNIENFNNSSENLQNSGTLNNSISESGEKIAQNQSENKIIIYLPDIFTFVQENSISIKALASLGFKVISADFFDPATFYFKKIENKNYARSFYARYLKIFKEQELDTEYFTMIKTQELFAIVNFLSQKGLLNQVACVVADGNANLAVKKYNELTKSSLLCFTLNENIPGYIAGMGNLALFQPAVYNFLQDSPTDGWNQAQIIAKRVQKFILAENEKNTN